MNLHIVDLNVTVSSNKTGYYSGESGHSSTGK